jgi:hypothetical protein
MSDDKNIKTFDVDAEEKVTTLLNPVIHNGKLAYKQIIKTMKYSKLQGKFKLASKKVNIISYEEVHKDELLDEVTIPIVIKRSAIDTVNVVNVSAYFKTTSTITINNPAFKVSISDGKPYLHQRDGNVVSCQIISPVLPDSRIYTISIDGNMTKISENEVLDLIRKGAQVFYENPASRRPEDRFRIVLQEA